MVLPSGAKRPLDSPSPKVTCFSFAEPSSGTAQRWFVFVFFSSDTSVTEKRTHLPEGEICGSETRFIAMRSAKVMGRFCWAASGSARAASRRADKRRIGGKCSAVGRFVSPGQKSRFPSGMTEKKGKDNRLARFPPQRTQGRSLGTPATRDTPPFRDEAAKG